MEPLAKIKRTFIWLRIYPAGDSVPDWKKNAHILVALLTFLVLSLSALSYFVYFLNYFSTDLDGSTLAILRSLIIIEACYNFIAAYWLQLQIHTIFESLSAVYKASKSLLNFNHLI